MGDPGDGGGVRDPVPELERAFAQLRGARVGEGGAAEAHALDRGPERLLERVRLHPVERDEHGARRRPRRIAGARLERTGVSRCARACSRRAAARRRRPRGRGRAGSRSCRPVDDEHAGVDRLPQGGFELVGARRPAISVSISWSTPTAACGEHPHDLLRAGAERLVAAEQQLAQGVGHRSAVSGAGRRRPAPRRRTGPLAALEERARLLGARRAAEELARLRAHLARGEPGEHDAATCGGCARARRGTRAADARGRRRRCGSSARAGAARVCSTRPRTAARRASRGRPSAGPRSRRRAGGSR